ncbi:hypothetical protein EI77_01992 [Prosthecobacter fusiformis]|uniref:Uncharacterized protein n=1 Tax=Prosthecobacter fusiformis TaxID=48464 RepID=A0A4R7RY59_9BACT|nr:hypothetical protein [Prosthecobacter fusiformis]TDU70874.1 hypothetical protein EI77_01992 [Prosthecobacter fusiformis]
MKAFLSIVLLLIATLNQVGAQSAAPPVTQQLPTVKPETDGKVWGALIFASNKAGEKAGVEQPPASLSDLPQRLGKVFPYQHYEILGQHLQDVFREYESWVVPSKDLFLKVDSKGPASGGGVNLHLQFWKDQQVLVKTDAVLRSGSPLFIGGPKWRDGQLIFVLVLQ